MAGNISANIAQATAVAGYDLFKDEPEARQSFARVIKAVGVVGSAALGDIAPELIIGGVKQGKFTNTTAGVSSTNGGACLINRDLKEVDIFVPANAQVQMIMNVAAATNAVRAEVHFGTPRRASGGGTRRYGRRTSGGTRRGPSTRRSTGGMY